MLKSRLQELCQSRSWSLPTYETTRDGPSHCPLFKATVEVNGETFLSPNFCKSAKEAQNLAAKIAVEHFSGVSNSNINTLATIQSIPVNNPDGQNPSQTIPSSCYTNSTTGNKRPKSEHTNADGSHIHKNQLQIYSQKKNIDLPQYSTIREGPPHACRFRSSVTVGGTTHECREYFHTVKEAESAAAKAALTSLFPDGISEEDPYIYKNLLQEMTLKELSCLPKYTSLSIGPSHKPVFVSTVEIKGEIFQGQECKTKKLAELSAAKVAYFTKKEREHIQGCDKEMKSAVEDTPKISDSVVSSRGDTEISNQHIPGDVKQGSSESLELGKEGNDQEVNRASDLSKQPGSPSTVVTNTGMSVNLEPTVAEDGSKEWKIVVIPNGPDVKIPPGVTILEQDEKHIVVTKFNSPHKLQAKVLHGSVE